MSDDDLLRGYRPSVPPPGLRARITRATRSATASVERPRLRDWLPALAAAAMIILFSVLSYRVNADLDTKLTVPDDLRPVEQWGLPAGGGELK